MKYFFVVNPTAGNGTAVKRAKEIAKACFYDDEYELYETTCIGDATRFVQEKANTFKGEKLRFYACGGDGTLNEVVNGAAESLTSEAIKMGVEHTIDVLKACGRYCINICGFGLDAMVAQTMINVKTYPVIGGKNAYTTGIVHAFFCGMKHHCTVSVDGNVINPNGEILLCTVANGKFVGGKYKCAPKAENDDGMLDVCLVKPVSRFKVLEIIEIYKKGNHLDSPKAEKIIEYRRGTKVDVTAHEGFSITLDGEIEHSDKFSVEVIPGGVNFVVPPCFIKEKIKEKNAK